MIDRGFLKHAERIRETLKTQNYVDVNDQILVRIPSVPGRIHKIDTDGKILEVVYVYERWYDPEKKQTRNRQVIIGHALKDYLPGMYPTDHYYEYFDFTTGMLLKKPEPEASPEDKSETPKAEKSPAAPTTPKEEKKGKEEQKKEALPENETTPVKKTKPEKETTPENKEASKKEKQPEEKASSAKSTGEEKTQIIPAENLPAKKQERAETRIMRLYQIKDEDPDEEETPEYKLHKARFEILTDILENIHTSIKNQARKRPDTVVNPYKAQKINTLLMEIRDYYKDTGVEDLMELIETPHVEEEDGRNTLVGTTYSDADILLEYYASVMNHIS